jgi:SAM-dependent methyltransferase
VNRPRRRVAASARLSALVLLCVLAAACGPRPRLRPLDAPYVPTPDAIAVEMLRLAGVTAADTVYDLGSGDGRVVIAAARHFGARGVGVELDASLIHQSNENAVRAGVADRVSFVWQDLFVSDIRDATVVTLYLFQEVNLKLRPKLLRELRPGARLVSHDYDMGEWQADQVLEVRSPERVHTLLYWVVPADVAGTWLGTIAGAADHDVVTLRLEQRFQRVTGTVTAGGREAPIAEAVLSGEMLAFATAMAEDGREASMRFRARVAGERMSGEVRVHSDGSVRTLGWSATRSP